MKRYRIRVTFFFRSKCFVVSVLTGIYIFRHRWNLVHNIPMCIWECSGFTVCFNILNWSVLEVSNRYYDIGIPNLISYMDFSYVKLICLNLLFSLMLLSSPLVVKTLTVRYEKDCPAIRCSRIENHLEYCWTSSWTPSWILFEVFLDAILNIVRSRFGSHLEHCCLRLQLTTRLQKCFQIV